MHQRLSDSVGHRERGVTAVVVDDVERVVVGGGGVERPERAADMVGFEQRPLDALRMRRRQERPELGIRARARRTEELDVVPAVEERFGAQRDDLLDPSIARRGQGDPRRSQHCDAACLLGPSGLDGRLPHRAPAELLSFIPGRTRLRHRSSFME